MVKGLVNKQSYTDTLFFVPSNNQESQIRFKTEDIESFNNIFWFTYSFFGSSKEVGHVTVSTAAAFRFPF